MVTIVVADVVAAGQGRTLPVARELPGSGGARSGRAARAGDLHLALPASWRWWWRTFLVPLHVFAVDEVGNIQHHLAAIGQRQLTSSSRGMKRRCIWKLTARARVWRSLVRAAFSRRLLNIPSNPLGGSMLVGVVEQPVVHEDLQVASPFCRAACRYWSETGAGWSGWTCAGSHRPLKTVAEPEGKYS